MRKHEKIISKLTDLQKVHILTDINYLASKDMKILGVPPLKAGNMKNIMRGFYPHRAAVARSWDKELWHGIATDKAALMNADGVGLAEVPGARVKLSPYRREVTEDPYFASVMSGIYQKAATDAGMYTALSGCYLTKSDTDFMDVEPNERTVAEFIAKPYINSIAYGGAEAVVSDSRAPSFAYKNVNLELHSQILADGKTLIADNVSDEDTVGFIERGGICVSGSALALETAMKRYVKLKSAVDSGDLPIIELESEIASHNAISADVIDDALDRVLDLAFSFGAKNHDCLPLSDTERASLAAKAAYEATVLVKNEDGRLPIGKKCEIGIIGDIGYSLSDGTNPFVEKFSQRLTELGRVNQECVRGYDFASVASNKFINEAIKLASDKDIIILLLGFGDTKEKLAHKTGKLTLPPNQLLLADSLSKIGKQVIAVICTAHAPDIAFAREFAAVIIAPPIETEGAAEALADVITGEKNPSGHLSYTLYAQTETAMTKAIAYKKNYGQKQGPFVGYRYYDTADMTVGYPFGHGLSYSKVIYTALSVKNGAVTLTLENKSPRATAEVVQVYAGHCASTVIRPKKELCGFERVELLPMQTKKITVNITLPTVYDTESGKHITESGHYKIYVGASVSDIRLHGETHVSGYEHPKADGEHLCDYLQSVSNIKKDKFTLEADYDPMKKSIKNILFGIGALAIAISIGIFNSITDMSSGFLSVIAAIIAASGIIFFILEGKERSALFREEKKNMAEKNKAHFAAAEEISVPAADKLFRAEFDNDEEEDLVQQTVVTSTLDDEYLAHVIPELTLERAVESFDTFATERGYKFASGVIANLFASLASSRLIVVENQTSESFKALMVLMSEYFDTKIRLDKLDENYKRDTDLFYTYTDGNQAERNIIFALRGASKARELMHFAAIDGVVAQNVSDYINPLLRYLKNPASEGRIIAKSESGTQTLYRVPGNLYVILNLTDSAVKLPETISKIASVVSLAYSGVSKIKETTPVEKFKYYQMLFLAEKLASVSEISEDFWKKIDRFESYAAKISDYKIGNKLWLGIEKHVSALIAIGLENDIALDTALASRLMPSLIGSVNEKITQDDRTLSEMLDVIFGEDGMSACRATVKAAKIERTDKSPEPSADAPAGDDEANKERIDQMPDDTVSAEHNDGGSNNESADDQTDGAEGYEDNAEHDGGSYSGSDANDEQTSTDTYE